MKSLYLARFSVTYGPGVNSNHHYLSSTANITTSEASPGVAPFPEDGRAWTTYDRAPRLKAVGACQGTNGAHLIFAWFLNRLLKNVLRTQELQHQA